MRLYASAISVVAIGLVTAGAVLRWPGGARVEVPQPQAIPVTIAQVRAASDAEVIQGTGVIVLKRETPLSFKYPGVIESLTVRAGDTVKADQVLASLNQIEIGARERDAGAQLDAAQIERDRALKLFGKGFVSARRVDDAKAAYERAKAAFDVVHFDRRWTELRAPWDGVILNRFAEAGEIVAPGKAVLVVGDTTGGFNLNVPLADRDVARLAVGDRADVTFAASDKPVEGRVTRLAAKADARTGSFEAEISLEAAPASLRSGMMGDAVIHPSTERTSAMLAIPAEAIVEGDGDRATVYIAGVDEGVELREIRISRLDGSYALVLSGLLTGERVVVSGAAYVRPGDRIRVVETRADLGRGRQP
jgi:RND family efflux transporter MFP subunit